MLGLAISSFLNFMLLLLSGQGMNFFNRFLGMQKVGEVYIFTIGAPIKLLMVVQVVVFLIFFIKFTSTCVRQPQYGFKKQLKQKDENILWVYFIYSILPLSTYLMAKALLYAFEVKDQIEEMDALLLKGISFIIPLLLASSFITLSSKLEKRLPLDFESKATENDPGNSDARSNNDI